MIKGRVIAIGDVHGCHAELKELIGLLAPTDEDLLVFLGDLVNRGPESHDVVELARTLHARSLLGNHELRLLNARRTGDDSELKDDDKRTIKQLTPADWNYLENMTLFHHLPDIDTVLVHGGFLPGQAWQTQPAAVVTRIQVIDRDGRPRKRNDSPNSPFWADLWSGPPFVVYGHTPRHEVYEKPASLGIDTGCVYGGHLTAYILPEKKLVQVKAREKYS
jgi:serine/threonine protein phosphatase 1